MIGIYRGRYPNHWERAGIQLAFTVRIFVNTWTSPFEGLLVDRYGPRPVVMAGGLLAAISWFANSRVASLTALYASAIVGVWAPHSSGSRTNEGSRPRYRRCLQPRS